MAGQYDNTNRGVLFRNKKKQPGDNRPDYTGKLDIEGKEVWLSGWIKKSNKTGESYLSVAIQQQQQQQQQQQRPAAGAGAGAKAQKAEPQAEAPFAEEDIPF